MAKELPYFKFVVNEWITGDITLEDYHTQGVFISICAYYWSKDCEVTMETVRKRFRNESETISNLISSNILKDEDGFCVINFLDEQKESKEVQKIVNRENGAKGGRPKKTEQKPNGLFFANRNETETKANENRNITNIEERKGKERKEEDIPPTPDPEIFNHSEIVSFVNQTFKKNFTDRNLTRFDRDIINDLIRVHGYSKEQVFIAWRNAAKDSFHIEKRYNVITFKYLSETKTIERYVFWKPESSGQMQNSPKVFNRNSLRLD